MMCELGNWGNYYSSEQSGEIFINDLCLDEIVPDDKDACNGVDDNCDCAICKAHRENYMASKAEILDDFLRILEDRMESPDEDTPPKGHPRW